MDNQIHIILKKRIKNTLLEAPLNQLNNSLWTAKYAFNKTTNEDYVYSSNWVFTFKFNTPYSLITNSSLKSL